MHSEKSNRGPVKARDVWELSEPIGGGGACIARGGGLDSVNAKKEKYP